MRVSYVFRSPEQKRFSIENVFNSVIPIVSKCYETKKFFVPCFTTKPRAIYNNLKFGEKIDGDVIHITGDIHYIGMMTPKEKTIITVHDMVSLENSKGVKHFILKLFWYTIPLHRCKYITAISNKTRDDLINLYPELAKKIFVIPDPVDEQFVFTEHQFNKKCPTILQIGTKENKNVIRVSEALEGVCCKLCIVGKISSKQKEALEKYHINYVNYYDISNSELLKLYQNSDIVVFASTYEGFGMPIIESQMVGRIVIASNIEPMVSVAGDGAILVDPYDVKSIREGIISAIEHDEVRNRTVQNGLNNAMKYKSEIVAHQYTSVYKLMAKDQKVEQ